MPESSQVRVFRERHLRRRARERYRQRLGFTPSSPSFLVATSAGKKPREVPQCLGVPWFPVNSVLGQTQGRLVVALRC